MKPRERIIQSAQYLFWSKTFQDTNIDQICEFAEVNKANFYRYFKSKQDLGLSVISKNWHDTENKVYKNIFKTGLEAIWELIENGYYIQKEEKQSSDISPGCPFLTLAAETSTSIPLFAEKLREITHLQIGYFSNFLKEAQRNGEISKDANIQDIAEKTYQIYAGGLILSRAMNNPLYVKNTISIIKELLKV